MAASELNLNVELFRQLSYIADDEGCMKKALAYIRKLALQKEKKAGVSGVVSEAEEEYRPLSKAEILEGLSQAGDEARLYQEKKLPLLTWEEVRDAL